MANDHYIDDYPTPEPMPEDDSDLLGKAIATFLRSSLVDYSAITLNRYPTVSEARHMADQAQVLLMEVTARGWDGDG